MTFDRAAFEAQVSQRSPLLPSQFDTLFGGKLDGTNKQVAWHYLTMSSRDQQRWWMVIRQWQKAVPDTVLSRVL